MQQEQKYPGHLDLLDYARAVAIISVVAFHCICASGAQLYWNTWLRNLNVSPFRLVLLPANLGFLGVAIFFVVSGFCIHLAFHRQGCKYGDFFIRRFFRIYPAYLATLLFFALLFPQTALDFSGAASNHAWTQLVYHLLLIHNFQAATFMAINPSFWSLAIEVQLYLLYPLLLFLVARLGWKQTLVALAITETIIHAGKEIALFNAILGHHFLNQSFQGAFMGLYHLGRSPLAYWFSWALGALMADCYLKNKPQPLAGISPVVWLGGIAVCFLFRPLSEFTFMMGSLATASVLSRSLSNPVRIAPDRLCTKFILKIGAWSYSLYLLQQPLLWAAPTHWLTYGGSTARLLSLGVVALTLVPFSFVLFTIIEVPGIKAGKNLVNILKSIHQSRVEVPVVAPKN